MQQQPPRGRFEPSAREGDAHLLDTARRIVRQMDRTSTMTEETMRIFAEFDNRLTRERLSPHAPEPLPATALDRSLRYLERQISRSLNSQRPIWSNSDDTRDFLDAVDTLIGTIHGLDPLVPGDNRILSFAQDILSKSMDRLEYEFKYLIDLGNTSGAPLDPFSSTLAPLDSDSDSDSEQIPVALPVTDYNVIIDALPAGTILDLQEIAKRMVLAKYSKECADVYILSRRDFVDESLARMGLSPWPAAEVHASPWKELESEIKRWVQGSKVAFRILFPSERRLCDRVFAGIGANVADLVFTEVCRVAANQLLGFADSIASASRSPERLFGVVDLYEALRDLLPEIDHVFADPHSAFVWDEAREVLVKLGDAIRGIFTELENLIRRDPPNSPIAGAGVHPITRYVMNYLRAASASWRTLEEVMEEEQRIGGGSPSTKDGRIRPNSSLSVRIGWIMNMLLTNLDAKAASYRDPAQSSFFLLNNGRYIVKKAHDEIGEILGENWIRGQVARVKQWQNGYLKSTWSKVAETLRLDDLGYGGGGDVVKGLREKVDRFNRQFDMVHEMQRSWVVADEELKELLVEAGLEMVSSAYMALLGRFRGGGKEVMRQMDRWTKYGEGDVERMIRELYQGPQRSG